MGAQPHLPLLRPVRRATFSCLSSHQSYYSQLPYALGENAAMKFTFVPLAPPPRGFASAKRGREEEIAAAQQALDPAVAGAASEFRWKLVVHTCRARSWDATHRLPYSTSAG